MKNMFLKSFFAVFILFSSPITFPDAFDDEERIEQLKRKVKSAIESSGYECDKVETADTETFNPGSGRLEVLCDTETGLVGYFVGPHNGKWIAKKR
ncbi:MAG: hypothetical protein NTV43_16325 [Methylococcales bacterium]|nr:hypothetical protein [Methylococcales bacterium]